MVITTRDRCDRLSGAIESVLRSPLIVSAEQIIVVDDDSHDETEKVAGTFGVRYVRVAHHSSGASRNTGLAQAETPYITYLDDDDVWLPGNIEGQLVALEANPRAAFAYGMAMCASDDLEPIVNPEPWIFPPPPLPSGHVPEDLHVRGYPQLGVVLFRKEAVAEVGGSDPGIRYHQDADLMIRIASRHEIVGVEIVGMLHRLRSPSMARSDYFWGGARREVMHWRPKDVGVGWWASAKFRVKTRGLFCSRFVGDAAACIALGQRHQALICLWRALLVSPAQAFHHYHTLVSILWQSIS